MKHFKDLVSVRLSSCWSALLLAGLAGALSGTDMDLALTRQWPGFSRGRAQVVTVSGDYAYVSDGRTSGLRLIDIRDPVRPAEVGGNNFTTQAVLRFLDVSSGIGSP
jgi:hypothetical protein